ncbi:KxYKxGKxW signal peptide domain-containing protein [Lentilactobacillus parabuchneri]|uniref:KxYKxGKxW signal peptide domain-containing protein n=1 Tax=Lentilactobacillus parabuchneri TaxID=152331 RepID=UPI00178C9505|nr:KxYKxGKxW signal peptide domain-containing protein [Lentilactobacillus parabuchneri]QOJ85627.1 KxYKxGKxW signal peptide domain-containing protein [Lentilactobacillus parabuchneri]
MNRYKYNSRLYRDSLEKQEHYKLYKKGKLWLVAGISVFTSGLTYSMLSSHPVHADTTATYDDANTQSVSDVSAATATATQPQADVTSTSQSSDSSTTTAANSSSTTTGTDQAATASSTQSAGATSSSTTTPAASSSSDTQSSDASASSVGRTATSSSKSTKITNKTSNDLKVKKTTPKKVTKYTKKSAQSIVAQANKLMQSTQKQIEKGNAAANAKADDNIPTDDALTAIGTYQKAQQAQVLKTVKAAQKIAVKNKKQATMKLNSALAVVANMHDELNQATALVSADKKGVQAHVVANAKAAYDKVSMPSGTSAKVDAYGDLIVTASNTKTYNKVLASLHKQGLTGSFRQVVDPQQAMSLTLSGPDGASTIDADGNMDIDQTKANALSGSTITASFNISGNKGDKFFITVPSVNSWTDGSIATKTTNSDGSSTITWTLDADGSTKNETITFGYGGNYADSYDNIAKSPDTGKFIPGSNRTGAGSYNGGVPDGLIIPVTYGGTNQNTQYKKITFSNKQQFRALTVGSLQSTTTKKAGQNYIYTFGYNGSNDFDNLGALTAVIDLPTNFVFDPDETEYVQKNSFRTGIDVNTFKVLDGNKLEITVGGKNNFNAFSNGKVYFVGHYTAGTTGNQTFNLESVKTAYMPDSSGNAPVLADNGGEKQFTSDPTGQVTSTQSDYNSGHTYTLDPQKYPNLSLTDTITTKDVTVLNTGAWVNTSDSLVIGATTNTNNILGNFTMANFGNTAIDPIFTFKIPDGVESTGINLPLNEAGNSNWPKDTTYDVTVNYSNNASQSFTGLKSGTTVSSIDGTDVQLMQIPTGAHVTSYVVTQSEPIQPDNYLGYFDAISNGGEAYYVGSSETNDNDAMTYAFTLLGNVGTDPAYPVSDGQKMSIEMDYSDKNSNYSSNGILSFTATKDATTELTLGNDSDLPSLLQPGQTYTTVIGASYGTSKDSVVGANLNANAYRDSQGKVIN